MAPAGQVDSDEPEVGRTDEPMDGDDQISVGNIVNSVGVAIGRGARAVINVFPGQSQARANRNRRILLERVQNAWIEGVLERSVYGASLIELEMATQPGAVQLPWNTMVHQAPDAPRTLPRGRNILDVFEESGRALLILGAPGAGKTITLLELARQAIVQAQKDATQPIPVVFTSFLVVY